MDKTMTEIVAPMADDLILPAKMGMGVSFSPVAALATGKLLMMLAEVIDAKEALDHHHAQLRRMMVRCGLFVVVMTVASMILN